MRLLSQAPGHFTQTHSIHFSQMCATCKALRLLVMQTL